ncbi:DUF333 domain-containing protein [Nanoarchaeota archaeon]
MRYTILLISSLLLLSILSACDNPPQKYMGTTEEQSQKWETTKTGIANPASTYCIEQGFSLTMKEDHKGGQYGICTFHDSSWCEEWAYYKGYCEPETNITKCKDQYWGKSICPGDFQPVCAQINSTKEWQTFNNACSACISEEKIVGYRFDKCPE